MHWLYTAWDRAYLDWYCKRIMRDHIRFIVGSIALVCEEVLLERARSLWGFTSTYLSVGMFTYSVVSVLCSSMALFFLTGVDISCMPSSMGLTDSPLCVYKIDDGV